jgi:hypothetical protein
VSRRSPPSPVRRRRAAVGSPSSAAAACSRRALHGPAELGRAALCIWAEHGFDPEALKLNFIIFWFIQFIINSKICVGFFWTRKIMKQILLEMFKSVLYYKKILQK